jgi:type I restriction enzyme S subunit
MGCSLLHKSGKGSEQIKARMIPEGWKTYRIEELADKVGIGPFGSSIKVETFVGEGIPIISGSNLKGIRLVDDDYNFITREHADRLHSVNVFRGDVVFTHAGNIGSVAYIPNNSKFERYVLSQRQFYLRCNKERLLAEFITYFFKATLGQKKLLANSSSVGVPSIARPVSYLKGIEVIIPEVNEQKRISQILSSLDDKIELNLRMNNTLEAIAQAIFKEWFIDFRFPGFDGELVDGLPRGWRKGDLGELIFLKNGKVSPNRNVGGDYPVYGANGIIGFTYNSNAEKNVTVIGRVGSFCGSTYFSQTKCWITDNAIIACPKINSSSFVFLRLQSLNLNSYRGGSGQPLINQSILSGIKTNIPNEPFFTIFEAIILPLFEKIDFNEKENQTLLHLRDSLLPKLMTGKIRVA